MVNKCTIWRSWSGLDSVVSSRRFRKFSSNFVLLKFLNRKSIEWKACKQHSNSKAKSFSLWLNKTLGIFLKIKEPIIEVRWESWTVSTVECLKVLEILFRKIRFKMENASFACDYHRWWTSDSEMTCQWSIGNGCILVNHVIQSSESECPFCVKHLGLNDLVKCFATKVAVPTL